VHARGVKPGPLSRLRPVGPLQRLDIVYERVHDHLLLPVTAETNSTEIKKRASSVALGLNKGVSGLLVVKKSLGRRTIPRRDLARKLLAHKRVTSNTTVSYSYYTDTAI
jgi:hypothetical protein